MIYAVVEQVYTVLAANFATDWAGLCSTFSLGAPPAVDIVKRQNVDAMVRSTSRDWSVRPAIGIYAVDLTTQAKMAAHRLSVNNLGLDFYRRGAIANLPTLLQQGELAAEAMLLTIDRLAGSGGGVWGAGEAEDSVTVTFSDGYEATEGGDYQQLITVTVPVRASDEV